MTHQLEVAKRLAQLRRIKQVEEERDIPQSELAAVVGTTPESYGRYENGRRKVPDDAIIALAKFYGVSPGYIRYGEPAGASGQPTHIQPAGNELTAHDIAESRALERATRDGAKKAASGDRHGPKRRPKPR